MSPNRRLFQWLAELRLVRLTLTALLITLLVIVEDSGSEPAFRIAGLGLQLAGLLATAYGIYQTRLFFGQPGLIESATAWWRRAPWRPRSARVGQISGLSAVTTLASANLTTSTGPDASVERRVAMLEEKLIHLTEAFRGARRDASERLDKLKTELQEERRSRAAGQQEIHDRLKEVQTGGLGTASMGWVWVVLGSFLSAGSPEMAERYRQFGRLLDRALHLVT